MVSKKKKKQSLKLLNENSEKNIGKLGRKWQDFEIISRTF